ncbi:MAG: hypothetical protein U1A78_31970 [Polyangia bacterium]
MVLYQVLAGRPPFMGSGSGEVIAMHIYEPVPPLAPLAPDAPPALVDLCMRLLSKNKRARPSMKQVLTEIEALAETVDLSALPGPSDFPVLASTLDSEEADTATQQPSTLGQFTGQSRRFGARPLRRWLAAGGLVVLALGGGLASRSWRAKPPVATEKTPIAATATPAAGAPERTVSWSLRSQPAGAQVVRAADGEVLGTTPWIRAQPAAAGTLELRLRHPGFLERRVQLDRGSDASRDELLDPLPAAAAPIAGKETAGPAGPAAATSHPTRQTRPTRSPSRGKRVPHERIQVED